MKRFFTTIKNIFSIEDLRVRILNTIGFLIIFRLGSFLVLPGIEPSLLTGNQGGKIGPMADIEIRVPHMGYADRIQEIHIKIIHILILLIEKQAA